MARPKKARHLAAGISEQFRTVSNLTKAAGVHKVFQFWADVAFSPKYDAKIADRIRASELLAQYGFGKPVDRSVVLQADIGPSQKGLLPELDAQALVALAKSFHQKGMLNPENLPRPTPSAHGLSNSPAEEVVDADFDVDSPFDSSSSESDEP